MLRDALTDGKTPWLIKTSKRPRLRATVREAPHTCPLYDVKSMIPCGGYHVAVGAAVAPSPPPTGKGKKKPRRWCTRAISSAKCELPWSPLFIAATSHKTLNSTSLLSSVPKGHIYIESKVR